MTRSPQYTRGTALRRFLGDTHGARTYRNLAPLALSLPLGLALVAVLAAGVAAGADLASTLLGTALVVPTSIAADRVDRPRGPSRGDPR